MSEEAKEKVTIDPFHTGLVYHTISVGGKFFHLHPLHVLMVNLSSGDVAHFTWDEITEALVEKFQEKEKLRKKEEEIAAKILAQQAKKEEATKPKPAEEPQTKPEGYKGKKQSEPAPAPKKGTLSKKAAAVKKK